MKTISASRHQISGTAAERAAMDTVNLNPKDSFLESDTGTEYVWDGDSWVALPAGVYFD